VPATAGVALIYRIHKEIPLSRQKKKSGGAGGGARGFYIILAVVGLVGIAAIAYALTSGRGATATEPVEVAGIEDARTLVERAEGIVVGSADAPVKLIVFSDFMCPYCGQFALQVKPLLVQNEVAAGHLQLVAYDFPLGGTHRHSFAAARAARCAGDQGRYWEYHDALYARQARWSGRSSTPLNDFEEYAAELGLDRAAFSACLRSDRHAEVVTANIMLGERLGVRGTPTVIVNGRRVERWGYPELSELIKREAGV